jgi:hypothetical protein
MTRRETGFIASNATSTLEESMAIRSKRKFKFSGDHFLAAGRTAGALLMGNAALIGATKPEQWQDALKVAAVGLFLVILCSIVRSKVPEETGADHNRKEKP